MKENKKTQIARAAFDLFREKGYKQTTIDDILERAACAKGTFYHYFSGKGELLSAWAPIFDECYADWYSKVDKNQNKLVLLQQFAHAVLFINEQQSSYQMLTLVHSAALTGEAQASLTHPDRVIYEIITELIRSGQQRGEVRSDTSFITLTKMFIILLRGTIYDWTLDKCAYSLLDTGFALFTMLLSQWAPGAHTEQFPPVPMIPIEPPIAFVYGE